MKTKDKPKKPTPDEIKAAVEEKKAALNGKQIVTK